MVDVRLDQFGLYNAFLNDITTEGRRDKVSSEGYALGYLGGGLLLAVNLVLLSLSDRLGISKELTVRISLLCTNTERAIHDASDLLPTEAAGAARA